jgi:hypothetical protein
MYRRILVISGLRDEWHQRHRVMLWGKHGMLEGGFKRVAVCLGHHTGVLKDHVLNDAGSGKRDCSRPLPSELDVKVSLHYR